MSNKQPRYVYWDSCLFLAYVNEEPDRVKLIDDLWGEVSDGDGDRIITSTISIVEVAHANYEKRGKVLSKDVENTLDAMWHDPSVLLVEPNLQIVSMARTLIRDAIPNGLKLKPFDALHLATAQWVNRNIRPVADFFSYDSLARFGPMIGVQVGPPFVLQGKLDL